jgi:hypothetical protein
MRKLLFVFVAAAFVMVSAVPAMAQDEAVSISGNVRMETYWNNRDSTLMSYVNGVPSSSDTDILWALQPVTTNLNFNFKAGDISATIVARPDAQNFADWFATWNFGAGQLIVGNVNNPAWRPFSSLSIKVANSPWYGAIDAVKQSDQLQLVFPIGGGSLRFGAIKPATPSFTFISPTAAFNVDNEWPKLEASYDMRFGGFNLWVGGGYQTTSADVTAAGVQYSYDLDSYLIGAYGSYAFGPISINGNYWWMQNPQAYGFSGNPAPFNAPGGIGGTPAVTVNNAFDANTNSIIDVDYWGWHLSAGWKLSDMLTLQAGYGMGHWERDPSASAGELYKAEDERGMYYINMPIFAAKGFTITPEVGVYDEKDTTSPVNGLSTDQGKTTYYGVTWVLRF